MFEAFFNLLNVPFERGIPVGSLYSSPKSDELHKRLLYTAQARKFCVVTGDVGVGKTTAMRKFTSSLDRNLFRHVYISDSALTPRVFYREILKAFTQLEKPPLYRSDGKHKMMLALENTLSSRQTPVIIIDEAHHPRTHGFRR